MKLFYRIMLPILFIMCCIFSAQAENGHARTREDAVRLLTESVMAGETSVTITADEAIYGVFSEAESVFDIFCESKIATAEWDFCEGEFTISNISAYPNGIYCQTTDDAVKAFADKQETAVLHLSRAFYEEFIKDDFQLFFRLDGMVGIESKECVYYADTRCFVYENVRYHENFSYIETVDELNKHISECAQRQVTKIAYALSKNMFDLTEANAAIEYEILARNGVFQYTFLKTAETRNHTIEDIVYYPGYRVVYAYQNDCLETLTEEEIRLYEEASPIACRAVSECEGKPEKALSIEKTLIKEIAVRCEYLESDENVYNTALGVLLYGKADCDGYSDAMYLLGNLAGLHVEYQMGNIMTGGCHMWNVIETEYGRYFTDVTGCDLNDKDFPAILRPDWMGMGLETASERYIWQTVSQNKPIDRDNPALQKYYLMGNLFSSAEDARVFLDENTEPFVQLAITGITEEEREQAALETVYGFGGPYYSWVAGDTMYVTIATTWFAQDNFYDCCTEEDVIKALSAPHAEIIVRLNGGLYETYLADGGYALSEMEKAAGIQSSSRSLYDSTRVFVYKDVVKGQ